jgi:ribosomal protein S18 acetylase RimI-like enzyme
MQDIQIQEVTEFSPELADRIRELAQMIGHNHKELTDADLQEIIDSKTTTLFVAIDQVTNKIAGMATLIVYRIPYVRKAYFDDLVVDETYRGKGIGSELIKRVIHTATEMKAAYLDFSSRPRREEGNSLYEKFGFEKRNANVYRHIIDYGEL